MNYRLVTKPSIEPHAGVLIDNVLADGYCEIIYDGWDIDSMGQPQDFGGGVIGVTCQQLLEVCERSYYKMANLFPGITRSDAKEIIAAIQLHTEG